MNYTHMNPASVGAVGYAGIAVCKFRSIQSR